MSALVGTYDFGTSEVSFCFLSVRQIGDAVAVEDNGQMVPVAELDGPYGECAIEILEDDEQPSEALKIEMSDHLKRRFAFLK